jgi:hypothetical protein
MSNAPRAENHPNEGDTAPSWFAERDPRFHTANIKRMLQEVLRHAQAETGTVKDPLTQSLLKTTETVVDDLLRRYKAHERQAAWMYEECGAIYATQELLTEHLRERHLGRPPHGMPARA